MAKKSARKSSPKKAATRKAPAAPVRRRTPAQAIKLAQTETGRVPVRTTARIFALNQAGALGITLSKPQLRRATDRVEKLFKERGIGGARPVEPITPLDPPPAPQTEQQHVESARNLGQTQYRYSDPPRVNQGIGNSVGSAPATVRRPLDQAIANLENAVGQIFEASGTLVSQLHPLLPQNFEMAPGNPPIAIDGNATIPLSIANAAAKLEGLAQLIRSTRDALAL